MGEMAIMDPMAGDLRVTWDPDNADEVEAARAQFDAMKKKGFQAFAVDGKGKKTEFLQKFDPAESKMILSPIPRGG